MMLFLNFICLGFNMTFAHVTSGTISVAVNVMCLVAKFICATTFTLLYVQAIEVFPTPIRTTGMGFASFLSGLIGIGGPYVVYLGTIDRRIPYFFMGVISLVGSVAASFLPETLGADLPETLEEADSFGRDHPYFSWRSVIPKRGQKEKSATTTKI